MNKGIEVQVSKEKLAEEEDEMQVEEEKQQENDKVDQSQEIRFTMNRCRARWAKIKEKIDKDEHGKQNRGEQSTNRGVIEEFKKKEKKVTIANTDNDEVLIIEAETFKIKQLEEMQDQKEVNNNQQQQQGKGKEIIIAEKDTQRKMKRYKAKPENVYIVEMPEDSEDGAAEEQDQK
ncbi:hypothetical protein PIB30_016108 [Stylosanthes scabra]|uniref:Uncharacterized protein n=1 Tax=Stylosanthes scabra TaxID=79078 RepID=A0ABU6Q736_9FABA|nr:hypothetical protein [Stylosanthes scabra]